MPVAYLPSPASAVWHLGALPVRAYALCMVLGVVAGLWLTDRRYRNASGQRGVVQAISVWGNWFSQQLYGRPSGLPWAVAISPEHRAAGFQVVATFQPLF